jgi:hypothetical protein
MSPTLSDGCFVELWLVFQQAFFRGPHSIHWLPCSHNLLVEFLNKRENVHFFVGINCCVFGRLTIYFSIEVKESCFFYFFFKTILDYDWVFFFFKQTYLWGPYSIGKKLFQLMIRLIFFSFFFFKTKLFLGPYSTEKKKIVSEYD